MPGLDRFSAILGLVLTGFTVYGLKFNDRSFNNILWAETSIIFYLYIE